MRRQRSYRHRRHIRSADRGASAIEYAGLIVLAALILSALVAVGIPGKISTNVRGAICTILREQGCGGKPSASGRPREGRPSSPSRASTGALPRFTGGVLAGLRNIATPPPGSSGRLPVHAGVVATRYQSPQQPPRGGDNSTEHNRVALDTKQKIEQVMGDYVLGGQVTVDCEPGGATANCIPGGHKSGNGGMGRADIVLRGYDQKTLKPVIYVWEVKPATRDGRREAREQLDRYVQRLQEQVGPGTEVRYGFNVAPSTEIPGSGNRELSSWSEGDSNDPRNPSRGVRFYGGKEKKKQPQEQPQEQPQQQPAPKPVTPCGGAPPMARMFHSCQVPVFPGLPDLPLPEMPGLGVPVEPVPVV